MGKPVVASRLPMVAETCPPDTVAAHEPVGAQAMANAILAIVDDLLERDAPVAQTSTIVRQVAGEHEAPRYLALVQRLTEWR